MRGALIFFDIDGTICRYGESPPASAKEAFRRLHEKGNTAFLCTGRGEADIPREILDLGFEGIVSGMGADVRIGGRLLRHRFIPPSLLAETAGALLTRGIAAMFTGQYDVFCTENFSVAAQSSVIRSVDDVLRRGACPQISSLDLEYSGIGELEPCLPAIQKHSRLVEYNPNSGQTELIGVNKSKAIASVLKQPRYRGRKTYALGDSQNDLEMLRAVDVGIAMGDAAPEAAACADWLTRRLEDDGLYQALEHFGLI